MKHLQQYLQEIFEEEAGGIFSTPCNTMGAGEPSFDKEPLATPARGIPHQITRRTKRRKKSRPGLRDYVMTGKIHNV